MRFYTKKHKYYYRIHLHVGIASFREVVRGAGPWPLIPDPCSTPTRILQT
jgi:hypothetical protein